MELVKAWLESMGVAILLLYLLVKLGSKTDPRPYAANFIHQSAHVSRTYNLLSNDSLGSGSEAEWPVFPN